MVAVTTVKAPPMPTLALGALVWIPDSTEVWQKATVVEVQEGKTVVRLNKDDSEQLLPPQFYLREEELMTREGIKALDDLTQLTHLHEAAVLNSLNDRFEGDSIYTFTGPILIAVNPFKTIPGLYDEATLKHYIKEGYKQVFTAHKKPHVFSTAVDAYRSLCWDKVNQTILISGESGAGKTESTKFVMKLLALAGSQDWQRRSPVENQVLQSNPLLEAFGNAKTLRNDNSSRFGKFIEMQFRLENDREIGGIRGRLAGARIHTYLLETVRVCRQLKNERNYHSFYQLAAFGRSHLVDPETLKAYITPEMAKKFRVDIEEPLALDMKWCRNLDLHRYINTSGCTTLKNIDDVDEFQVTALAMHTVGISAQEQQQIWNLVTAVLHLGSIYFQQPIGNSEASEIAPDSMGTLKIVAELTGMPIGELQKCLCNRSIIVQKETYNKPLTVVQAEDTRDALARALYGTMFLRIVQETNKSIGYIPEVEYSCGVLDIFGFECFDVNSFEQLCINFTNERLQQFFNTFIFKCEEELYRSEGITWNPLDFPDNQDCVEVLQGKPTGVFAMLDEECLLPKGSDTNYVARLKQVQKDHPRFGVIKTKPEWFTIKHFAGPVHYCSSGFLDKNRDQLSVDVQVAVKASRNKYVADLFSDFLERADDAQDKKKKKQLVTVSLEFRNQLSSLMDTIQATAPHFIRCVKPNPQNRPDNFHRPSVAEQLRYAGVLQAVQVSRAGYPVRDRHENCYKEYRSLLTKEDRSRLDAMDSSSMRSRVQAMMDILDRQYNIPSTKFGDVKSWAVGETLVFLKHEAYEVLSTRRAELRQRKAVQVQAYWKMAVVRHHYLVQRRAAIIIQSYVRSRLAWHKLVSLREDRAARRITRFMRIAAARTRMRRTRARIIRIQTWFRMLRAKKFVREWRERNAATLIQTIWRMHHQFLRYQRFRKALVACQLRFRQKRAKEALRKLKVKAKDAANVAVEKQRVQQKLQEALEEVDQMRRMLKAEKAKNIELETTSQQLREALSTVASSSPESLTVSERLEIARADWEAEQKEIGERRESEWRSQMEQWAQEKMALEFQAASAIQEKEAAVALLATREAQLEEARQQHPHIENQLPAELFDKATSPMTPAEIGSSSNSEISPAYKERLECFIRERSAELRSLESLRQLQLKPEVQQNFAADHQQPYLPSQERMTPLVAPTTAGGSPLTTSASVARSTEGISASPLANVAAVVTATTTAAAADECQSPTTMYTAIQEGPTTGEPTTGEPTIAEPTTGDGVETSTGAPDFAMLADLRQQLEQEKIAVELQLAAEKMESHSTAQLLQSIIPVDSGELASQLACVLRPWGGSGPQRAGTATTTSADGGATAMAEIVAESNAALKGDVLLLGNPAEIAREVLVKMKVRQPDLLDALVAADQKRVTQIEQWEASAAAAGLQETNAKGEQTDKNGPISTETQESLPPLQPEDFQRREISVFDKHTMVRQVQLTVLRPEETETLAKSDLQRIERHFWCLGICTRFTSKEQVIEDYLAHPAWSKTHPMSRRFLIVYPGSTTSGSGSGDSIFEVDLNAIRQVFALKLITVLSADEFAEAMGKISEIVTQSAQVLREDWTRLTNYSQQQQRNAKLSKSPSTKYQTAARVGELVQAGFSNFFGGVRNRGLGGRMSRTGLAGSASGIGAGAPSPPVLADVLRESLKGDKTLLNESKNKEKTMRHGEVLKWYSINMMNKTAVTCVKFAKILEAKNFFLLAVATKAGPITTYKIRLSEEDRAAQDAIETVMPMHHSSGIASSDFSIDPEENAEWLAAPQDAVETWRHFEGHTKAVTCLFFTADGTQMVSTSIDCTVRFWALREGYLSKIFSDSVPILVAAFLPTDPRWFVTSNSKQVVRVVDSVEGAVVQRMKIDSEIRAICFDSLGLNMITGTKDGSLEAYEAAENNRLIYLTKLQLTGSAHAAVTCLSYCAGQPPFVVVNSCDSTITIVNCKYSLSSVAIHAFQVRQRIKIPHTCVPLNSRLLKKDDCVWLVSGSEDTRVKIYAQWAYRESEFSQIAELRAHEHSVLTVDVNEPMTILATADVSGMVQLWRRVTYKHLANRPESPTVATNGCADPSSPSDIPPLPLPAVGNSD